jgi:hypothetical protein
MRSCVRPSLWPKRLPAGHRIVGASRGLVRMIQYPKLTPLFKLLTHFLSQCDVAALLSRKSVLIDGEGSQVIQDVS